jgi:hypothetical protein
VENLSLRGTAAAMSIPHPHTILVRWTKAHPRLIASLGRQKAICEGPIGQLDGDITLEQTNNATMFLNTTSNVDQIFYQ